MDKGRMVVPCLSFPFKKMKELEKHVPLVGSNVKSLAKNKFLPDPWAFWAGPVRPLP
jgi:hypothetical protein